MGGQWVATYAHVYADDSDSIGSFVADGGFINVDGLPRVSGIGAPDRAALPTAKGVVVGTNTSGGVIAYLSPTFDSIDESIVSARELVGGLDSWS